MALSGSVSGKFSNWDTYKGYPFISWTATQSIAGNYSDVTAYFYFNRSSYNYGYNFTNHSNTTNVNGTTSYSGDTDFDLRPGTGDYLLRTITERVYHNSDGSKSFWCGWDGNTNVSSIGTYNFGTTFTLDTIPREAYITNAVSFTIGNNIPLTINNSGSLYVKALLYVNGTLIKTSNCGAVTSYTITPTSGENDDMYAEIPSATSCSMYVRLQTFTDATYAVQVGGNRDQTGTCSIDQTANKPTFTTFTIASVAKTVDNTDKYSNVLVSSALNTLTGSTAKMIQGFSKVRATVAVANKMVALNSATAVKYRFTNGSQYKDKNYSAVADVTLDIDNCSVNSFTVTAYDSRNLTTTPTALTLTNNAQYVATSLWGMVLIRDNSVEDGVTLQIAGSYWKEYFGGGTAGVQNTITAHYRYKETTESWGAQTWKDLTLTDTDGALSFDDYIEGDLGASGFDPDKSFNIEVRIYDKLTNFILEGTLPVGTPVIDMVKGGIAIKGKYDDGVGGALQVNGDTYHNGIEATDLYSKHSMYRQAIINGNFDEWRQGTSATLSDVTIKYLADEWYDYVDKNGGTLPTLTRSRQTLTAGELPGAFYFTRLATNGAGSSLGVSSQHRFGNGIEHGTRYLCGAGKKVTISFWARSSIANKKLGIYLRQNYGTGGSPTTTEIINGTNWTLTSSWVKYEYTIETNTLSGKTFGTANDDSLWLIFQYQWGSNYATRVGAVGAETYVGSGNIDIAQVQLCSGEVALPFSPQTLGEEHTMTVCDSRFHRTSNLSPAPATLTSVTLQTEYNSNSDIVKLSSNQIWISRRVKMFILNINQQSDGTFSYYITYNSIGYNTQCPTTVFSRTFTYLGSGADAVISINCYRNGGSVLYYDNYWNSYNVTAFYV